MVQFCNLQPVNWFGIIKIKAIWLAKKHLHLLRLFAVVFFFQFCFLDAQQSDNIYIFFRSFSFLNSQHSDNDFFFGVFIISMSNKVIIIVIETEKYVLWMLFFSPCQLLLFYWLQMRHFPQTLTLWSSPAFSQSWAIWARS